MAINTNNVTLEGTKKVTKPKDTNKSSPVVKPIGKYIPGEKTNATNVVWDPLTGKSNASTGAGVYSDWAEWAVPDHKAKGGTKEGLLDDNNLKDRFRREVWEQSKTKKDTGNFTKEYKAYKDIVTKYANKLYKQEDEAKKAARKANIEAEVAKGVAEASKKPDYEFGTYRWALTDDGYNSKAQDGSDYMTAAGLVKLAKDEGLSSSEFESDIKGTKWGASSKVKKEIENWKLEEAESEANKQKEIDAALESISQSSSGLAKDVGSYTLAEEDANKVKTALAELDAAKEAYKKDSSADNLEAVKLAEANYSSALKEAQSNLSKTGAALAKELQGNVAMLNDYATEYLPKGVIGAWKAGEFGPPASANAKRTRGYFITDAIGKALENMGAAFLKRDNHQKSQWEEAQPKRLEYAMARRNQKFSDSLGNAIEVATKGSMNELEQKTLNEKLQQDAIFSTYYKKFNNIEDQVKMIELYGLVSDEFDKWSNEKKSIYLNYMMTTGKVSPDKANLMYSEFGPDGLAEIYRRQESANTNLIETEATNKGKYSAKEIELGLEQRQIELAKLNEELSILVSKGQMSAAEAETYRRMLQLEITNKQLQNIKTGVDMGTGVLNSASDLLKSFGL